jgi:hypothetical protein
MKIHKYGITLQRLKHDDIELVRQMRNRNDIRQRMLFQKVISPQEQEEWFKSINNIYNNYFLIHTDGKKVGLVNGKNSDYTNLSSEGGIFIWDPDYYNSLVAPASSLIINDHAFKLIGFKKSFIRVLRSNSYALQYNKMMGYLPSTERISNDEYLWLELTAERYEKYNNRLRHSIGLLTGDTSPLSIDDFSFDDDSDDDLARLICPLPEPIRIEAQKILSRAGRTLPEI